jgi:ribosomal protein S18 acetylase RimI-like enzyme
MARDARVLVRPLARAGDEPWAVTLLVERWGATQMVTRGRVVDVAALPAFLALVGGAPAGLVSYELAGEACEITSLDSTREGLGVGTALLAAVREAARAAGCTRVWLITTNDNLHALRFYQRRGFVLAALHRNALAESRRLKPSIPAVGQDGIPLRDEIELEWPL